MAGIIKAGTPLPSGREVRSAAFNLDDMVTRAEVYLQSTRRQAAEILQAAQRQAEAMKARAEQAGQAAAQAKAEQAVDQKIAAHWQKVEPLIKTAIDEIQSARHDLLQRWEDSLVHLAVAMAGRIVRKQLESDPTITLEWIREALQLASGSGQLRLHLHPDDRRQLGDDVQQIVSHMKQVTDIEIVDDDSVQRGGCQVTTRFGMVDQQLQTQLDRIEQELGC